MHWQIKRGGEEMPDIELNIRDKEDNVLEIVITADNMTYSSHVEDIALSKSSLKNIQNIIKCAKAIASNETNIAEIKIKFI